MEDQVEEVEVVEEEEPHLQTTKAASNVAKKVTWQETALTQIKEVEIEEDLEVVAVHATSATRKGTWQEIVQIHLTLTMTLAEVEVQAEDVVAHHQEVVEVVHALNAMKKATELETVLMTTEEETEEVISVSVEMMEVHSQEKVETLILETITIRIGVQATHQAAVEVRGTPPTQFTISNSNLGINSSSNGKLIRMLITRMLNLPGVLEPSSLIPNSNGPTVVRIIKVVVLLAGENDRFARLMKIDLFDFYSLVSLITLWIL